MKILAPLLLILATALTLYGQSGNSKEVDEKGKARIPLRSGKITYSISGNASGTATLHFDRNGWRQILVKEIVIEKYGIKSTEKTIELIDGDYIYRANLDAKTGIKIKETRWSSLASYKERKEIDEIIMQSNSGSTTRDTTIVDHSAVVWEFPKGSTRSQSRWEGVALEEVRSLGSLKYTMTATSFAENIDIPEETFVLPEGISWVDPN